ncbi:MAG: hypothetical protein ABH950_05010 [Candidatus Altiarchaeota archaeon]
MDKRKEQRIVFVSFFLLYTFFLVASVSLYSAFYSVAGLFVGSTESTITDVPTETLRIEPPPTTILSEDSVIDESVFMEECCGCLMEAESYDKCLKKDFQEDCECKTLND